ncbi:MAG: type II toxin-antitoxin system death-on-curing family toxin [Bacteroidales bacterium]|nr:type II toxin-antitoxin system death-on-curing family toxin [Bacteroidales bacterium]
MITIDNAITIQNILIQKFGVTSGVRDRNLLESALLRPYQTFDKKELYKTSIEKAAALFESLITNHPFLDGNKRFGYVAMRLLLLDSDIDIIATEDEKYEFVISIAIGNFKFPEICSWINRHQFK